MYSLPDLASDTCSLGFLYSSYEALSSLRKAVSVATLLKRRAKTHDLLISIVSCLVSAELSFDPVPRGYRTLDAKGWRVTLWQKACYALGFRVSVV